MIGGVLAKFAGPKILLGVLIAAALALGFMWWMYSSAADDAAQASANADQAIQAAKQNREAAAQWRHNARTIARTLGERQKREKKLRAELAQTHDQLQEARANASQEVRDCLALRLPSAYLDGLRAAGGGDEDGDPAPDPAAGPD